MAHEIILNGGPLSPADVEAVARSGASVRAGGKALERMRMSRAVVEGRLSDGRAHYGINTGFGSLSRRRIAANDVRALQRNLVRSHASGIGAPLGHDVVRGVMMLLAASLSRGCSGVRPLLAERLIEMLNAGITPVVPEVGSVGASGDLAPLAHVALVLIGEGEAFVRGSEVAVTGAEAMAAAGLEPIELEAKEGLALINGTHLMAARGALLVREFERLFEAAVVAAAMSIDGCRGTDAFLDERVYVARNQRGPAQVAAMLRRALAESEIVQSHKEDDPRVQDPYSLRCAPVVLGAAHDAAAYVGRMVEAELGAVTDNPLVFAGEAGGAAGAAGAGDIVSAGNFHGMPMAIPLDVLTIAVSHLAGIAERRVFFMLSATDPQNPLPPYLSPEPGLHSGLMIAQYTAAACCNEIVGLCTPASPANIPTSAGIEDYNSFGPRSAAKAARAIELARNVVAIELLCAAEAIEYQRPLRSGTAVERAHERIRSVAPRLKGDRPPAPDIAAVARMIDRGDFPAS
jgi:histidine ammonia-lyase